MRDKLRSAEAVTSTMVMNVEVFVNKYCRVTLQEVSNQFSASKASTHQILYTKNRYEQGKC